MGRASQARPTPPPRQHRRLDGLLRVEAVRKCERVGSTQSRHRTAHHVVMHSRPPLLWWAAVIGWEVRMKPSAKRHARPGARGRVAHRVRSRRRACCGLSIDNRLEGRAGLCRSATENDEIPPFLASVGLNNLPNGTDRVDDGRPSRFVVNAPRGWRLPPPSRCVLRAST